MSLLPSPPLGSPLAQPSPTSPGQNRQLTPQAPGLTQEDASVHIPMALHGWEQRFLGPWPGEPDPS